MNVGRYSMIERKNESEGNRMADTGYPPASPRRAGKVAGGPRDSGFPPGTIPVWLPGVQTPGDFIRAQLAAPYPRWTILVKLPREITAPFLPELRQKWHDRNLRSFADVLRDTGLTGLAGTPESPGQEVLSDDEKADVERWLQRG